MICGVYPDADSGADALRIPPAERLCAMRESKMLPRQYAFTLIELLVVVSIISLLISILLPSLSRARDQAKGVHCLARLKDFGNALAAYENIYSDLLPPAEWHPAIEEPSYEELRYGWCEILFSYVYKEPIFDPDSAPLESFPAQRNVGMRWEKYFLCRAAATDAVNSGHYRVYLPAWSGCSYQIESDGRFGDNLPVPTASCTRSGISPRLPLIGDANERSERGDGLGEDDCSYIDAGEANIAGSTGFNGNRFSDRHYGGTNYLFQDLHGAWSVGLRRDLARDWDLNGVYDVDIQP